MLHTILTLIRKRWEVIFVGVVLLFVFIISFQTLTTKPHLWTDEAISINIAQSFKSHRILSVQTAPDSFFELPHLIQATGYPVTVPLAGVFALFDFGVSQARLYMLAWLIGVLLVLFYLARTLFSKHEAIFVFLLTASFASFYANGRTVTGEIPGFLFLLFGLYALLVRGQYFGAGLLCGLAVVAKPSVFALIIPTFFLTLLLERVSWRQFIRKLCAVASGMIPAAAVWVALVLESPFKLQTWQEIFTFYKNPYGESIMQNVLRNVTGFFDSSTLIYFGILFLLIVFTWFLIPKKNTISFLYTFVVIYTLFAFAYYLRSSGYLRYILIAELLILFILPHAVFALAERIPRRLNIQIQKPLVKMLPIFFLGGLVLLQGVHLFTAADISYSDGPFRVAEYVETNFPESIIGVLSAPAVGLLTDSSRTYRPVHLFGLPPIGKNPLFLEELPDVVVSYSTNQFIDEGRDILDKRYAPVANIEGYTIYEKQN